MSSLTTDVFSLEQLYYYQLDKVFTSQFRFAYNGGGYPANYSSIERIDYSNDTSIGVTRGPLTAGKSYLAAAGNGSYGWFGGGTGAVTFFSAIDRIDYGNDTKTTLTRGTLGIGDNSLSATSNTNFGYFGGGYIPSPGPSVLTSYVIRIVYASDLLMGTSRGPLVTPRRRLASTGNTSYGWFAGGNSTLTPVAYTSRIERVDYINDTATASPRGSLVEAKERLAATGNANYGWFGGGFNVPAGVISSVDRLDYSNDTAAATPRGPLTGTKYSLSATGTTNFGYFAGGYSGVKSTVDRIDYSNDTTVASPRGPLQTPRYAHAACSPLANAVPLNIRAPEQVVPGQQTSLAYFGGGNNATVYISMVDRLNYANDTASTSIRGPLSSDKSLVSAVSSPSFAYFGTGYTGSAYLTTVDRIDYSSETQIARVRGPLTSRRSGGSSTCNSSYGWFSGGYFPGTRSLIDRIDYSNDTATASPRGVLLTSKYYHASTGNADYGWFGGGSDPSVPANYSTVDRITYANDTAALSPRGPLFTARNSLTATGNANFGWFGGGSGPLSLVDRITYANDLVQASPRGSLSLARALVSATGNASYGWFGGGAAGGSYHSLIDRIDFSNDTAAASPRSILSAIARWGLGATSATSNALPQ